MGQVKLAKTFFEEGWLGWAAAALGLLVLALFIRSLRRGRAGESAQELPPYRLRDDFITQAEFAFYAALRSYLGEDILICPKVNLADLFFPAVESGERMRYLNKINRKHVDFLLCEAGTLEPICGVELDDSSHQRADRIARDEFVNQVYQAAGLPLIHVPLQNGYSVELLQDLFGDVLDFHWVQAGENGEEKDETAENGLAIPTCPKCGALMVLRVHTSGENKGYRYFGCPKYPKCRKTVPYVPSGGQHADL